MRDLRDYTLPRTHPLLRDLFWVSTVNAKLQYGRAHYKEETILEVYTYSAKATRDGTYWIAMSATNKGVTFKNMAAHVESKK